MKRLRNCIEIGFNLYKPVVHLRKNKRHSCERDNFPLSSLTLSPSPKVVCSFPPTATPFSRG
ncbi:hypothetical protein EZS27_017054 [termite gut metagenome]|uniref:Uncharacterized protein n=1 Tax=termite gut metagenome TaxID=433724 RepID=A0A5J4RM80_9ZZZZ